MTVLVTVVDVRVVEAWLLDRAGQWEDGSSQNCALLLVARECRGSTIPEALKHGELDDLLPHCGYRVRGS